MPGHHRPHTTKTHVNPDLLERAKLLSREIPDIPRDPIHSHRVTYTPALLQVLADDLWKWMREPREEYHVLAWCVAVGIPRQTVWELAQNPGPFQDAYRMAQTLDEYSWVEAGAQGRADSQISKLVLMSRHGYTDKQEQTVTGEMQVTPRLPTTPEECDRLMEAARQQKALLTGMVQEALEVGPALAGQVRRVPVQSKVVERDRDESA